MPATDPMFVEAVRLFRGNQLDAAESQCRDILNRFPDPGPVRAQTLHLWGLIAFQHDRIDEALDRIGQAIAIEDSDVTLHNSRGSVLFQAGRLQEAEAAFRRATGMAETAAPTT